MKIGILTFQFAKNYGALMQAYALQTFLIKSGYQVKIINRLPDIGSNLSSIKFKLINKLQWYLFDIFKEKYLKLTKQYRSNASLEELNYENYNAIITGSDQIWRIEYTSVGFNYFLDFIVNKQIKKISYAASFGLDLWKESDNTTQKVRELLEKFDSISVREDSGKRICKENFNLDSNCAVDPTLLLNSSDYFKLFKPNSIKPYIFVFLFDDNKIESDIAYVIQQELNLTIKDFNKPFNSPTKFNTIRSLIKPSVNRWLRSIYESEFVITDSYHCMIFALIFNKQFYVIANFNRGLTRYESLLRELELSDRLICSSKEINRKLLRKKIDYNDVNIRISQLQISSSNFLLNSLDINI